MTKNNNFLGIVIIFICTIFTAIGQYFLKKGVTDFRFFFPDILFNYQLLLGLVFYGLGMILLIFALKFGELSVVYPVFSLSIVWTTLISVFFLSESLKLHQYGGVLFILAGVVLINKRKK